MTARSAAVDAEDRKFANNTPKCLDLEWKCIPLVVEIFGAWVSMLSAPSYKSITSHSIYVRLNTHFYLIQLSGHF